MFKDKAKLLSKMLPLSLLGLLLLVMIVTVFMQAGNYGLTVDEKLQDDYGHSLLAWYQSFGKDTSFLHYPWFYYMPQHGAIFDTIVAQAQDIFGHPWYTRAVSNGLAGIIGVVAVALCGYELGGWWIALLAAFSLWLYPRYYGALYNNPKDVPFAAAMALTLWAILILMKRWERWGSYLLNSLLVGFCIGLAASIRVTACIYYLILAMILVAWWLLHGWRTFKKKKLLAALIKQGTAAVIIVFESFITMMLLWPYIFLNPLANLYDSIKVMQKFPWSGPVVFEGKVYTATELPRQYAPVWLVIGSPPAVVALALLGLFLACAWIIKKRALDYRIGVVILSLLIPLGFIVAMDATLYDGMRQFLFLVPPLVLVAAYGCIGLFRFLRSRWEVLAIGFACLVLASYLLLAKDMVNLYPYEYSYFSPLVGGLAGAKGLYDTDYWGICNKPAAEWLANHYRAFTHKPNPTMRGNMYDFQSLTYLPNVFRAEQSNPDFYISTTRFGLNNFFSNYVVIHTESLQGIPECVVKVNPAVIGR